MNIERALATEGWMFDDELAYLASVAARSKRVVEVGSWRGRSTCALACNLSPGGVVWAVDTWRGSPEQGALLGDAESDGLFSSFKERVQDLPVIPFRAASLYAAQWFAHQGFQFDAIFIDAMHEYDSVSADIAAWKPLLKQGGILCGHDYHPHWPGVCCAVEAQLPCFRVVHTIWTTEGA